MKLRFLAGLLIAIYFWLGSWVIMPSATALTSITLSNLSYEPCAGDETAGSVASGDLRPTSCYTIKG
ncbi:MAG: hypothetical protein ACRC2V_16810, partial [Xenococcaceae cyanobacterium]